MHREIPSLTALRAFEAAARHMSVSKAAEELNVTHAAVSQQIRALEGSVGVRLVTRSGRSLALTDAGMRYASGLQEGFRQLLEATHQIKAYDADAPVQITLTPTFAARWLMPRLKRFKQDNPEVTVSLSPETDLVDLEADGFDIGIRYGSGDWPGLVSDRIAGGSLAPVCSPDYLENSPPIREPADLLKHPLLEDDDVEEWEEWLKAAGVPEEALSRASYSMIRNLAYQAALEGHGVYLGALSVLGDDVRSGRLVLPLGPGGETDAGYYLARPAGRPLRQPARLFWDWILAESCRIPELR